jgi:hypothetical protein
MSDQPDERSMLDVDGNTGGASIDADQGNEGAANDPKAGNHGDVEGDGEGDTDRGAEEG